MPTFALEKLVRDGLIELYEELRQAAVTRVLKGGALREALFKKLTEETDELPEPDSEHDEIVSELADVLQVVKDLHELFSVDSSEVWQQIMVKYPDIKQADIEGKCAEKFVKKGGFSGGIYVKTLTLVDGDPWVSYYEKEPSKYPKVKEL